MQARHALATTALLGALLVGVAVAPAGAAQTADPPGSSFTVVLAANGDAQVTLVSTFDLDDESEAAAFDDLRTNQTARDAFSDRYTDDWRTVANNTEARTGREMAVTNSSLALSRTESTGVATYSVTWEGLAAAGDGMLTLHEPFASNYTTDREFVVVLPEGYTLESVSPGPTNTADGELVYQSGSNLDGLSIVATASTAANGTATPSSTPTSVATTGGSGPGVGAVGALAAVFAVALLARRRE
ncbi:PGF-CTERM sorting domain-containing protein [Haloarcula sp. S1CR25-12]|uniref:PGF-CTERM sorting domain-containing protein n=1 Tax=Haloarcula saliterrae TaxID=2950534 RepID=A0ABU2FEF4_9EURY|nr:PGF-CTERM sorting domain-containing protein [Haloarcula sp. S1CR25-12]MDS0260200.1 PGF-CTERM sorting domain-containing protein [Haloarcula sp. S1CR25-12]